MKWAMCISLLAMTILFADPGDDPADWLLRSATTAPSTQSTQPASQPSSPFSARGQADARTGQITLSDGRAIRGSITTTPEKPLRVWDEADKDYRDVPLDLVKSMRAVVKWERDEKEWQFKESGSDVKIYTGKTYPARELTYRVTLVNGQTVAGGIVAPLYVIDGDQRLMFVLNKRQKGEVGQKLKDLAYIKSVNFE